MEKGVGARLALCRAMAGTDARLQCRTAAGDVLSVGRCPQRRRRRRRPPDQLCAVPIKSPAVAEPADTLLRPGSSRLRPTQRLCVLTGFRPPFSARPAVSPAPERRSARAEAGAGRSSGAELVSGGPFIGCTTFPARGRVRSWSTRLNPFTAKGFPARERVSGREGRGIPRGQPFSAFTPLPSQRHTSSAF